MKNRDNRNRLTKYIISFILILIMFTATVFAWDLLKKEKEVDVPVGEPVVLTLEDGVLDTEHTGKKLIPNKAIKGTDDTYELKYTFEVKLDNPKTGVNLDTVITIINPNSSLFEIKTNFDDFKSGDSIELGLNDWTHFDGKTVYDLDLVITIKLKDGLDYANYSSVIGTLQTVVITIDVKQIGE